MGRGPMRGMLQVHLLLPYHPPPLRIKWNLWPFSLSVFRTNSWVERGVGDKPLGNPDPPVVGVVPTGSPSSEQIKIKLKTPGVVHY